MIFALNLTKGPDQTRAAHKRRSLCIQGWLSLGALMAPAVLRTPTACPVTMAFRGHPDSISHF